MRCFRQKTGQIVGKCQYRARRTSIPPTDPQITWEARLTLIVKASWEAISSGLGYRGIANDRLWVLEYVMERFGESGTV